MNNSAYSICNQATKDDMIEFKNQLTKFGDLNYFRHKTPLKNYPKIPDFLNPHTLSTTYFFPYISAMTLVVFIMNFSGNRK